jgi:hypothetical protein
MTGDEQGYNGWKNYETWAVALWIDNEQSSYEWSRDMARTIREDAPTSLQVEDGVWSVEEAAKFNLADSLKDWQESEMPDLEASVWTDLLQSAFEEVDWEEIAENFLSDLS